MSDLIKREDAIKAIEELRKEPHWLHDGDDYRVCGLSEAEDAIERLPSADRSSGEWLKFGLGRGTRILFCTNCERRIEVPLSQGDSNYDFCPNCGARMKGADDED